MKVSIIHLRQSLWLLIALAFFSCENVEDQEELSLITPEDAVEVVESIFIDGSEGIINEIEDAAKIAANYSSVESIFGLCGASFDSTLMKDYHHSRISASYATSWGWTMNCDGFNVPDTLLFGREAAGQYDAVRFSGSTESLSDWRIVDLVLGPNWIFSGTYDRSGSHLTTVRNQNNLAFTLTSSFIDMKVGKDDLEILTGEGSFSLMLSDDSGNSLTAEGNIIFIGNGTAMVTLNGESYEIVLD